MTSRSHYCPMAPFSGGHLGKDAQHHSQAAFKHHQGQGFHHFSEQLILALHIDFINLLTLWELCHPEQKSSYGLWNHVNSGPNMNWKTKWQLKLLLVNLTTDKTIHQVTEEPKKRKKERERLFTKLGSCILNYAV